MEGEASSLVPASVKPLAHSSADTATTSRTHTPLTGDGDGRRILQRLDSSRVSHQSPRLPFAQGCVFTERIKDHAPGAKPRSVRVLFRFPDVTPWNPDGATTRRDILRPSRTSPRVQKVYGCLRNDRQ